MIKRIVKLQFAEGKADLFLNEILPNQKHFTRNFKGCEHLELWQSATDKDLVFSYSFWQSETDLNAYRHSDKFRAFWKETKKLFAAPAEAHSVRLVEKVNK